MSHVILYMTMAEVIYLLSLMAILFKYYLNKFNIIAFSALMLLVGWQEEQLACNKTEQWDAGVVICLGKMQTCICLADATATHCLLLQWIQIGFTFVVYLSGTGSPV